MNARVGIMTLLLLLLASAKAQQGPDIEVRTAENTLAFPWAGGLNACQFGRMDLDNDGHKDLLVFDRHGNRLLTFLNRGARGEIHYEYAPEYAQRFPQLTDWALFADYDGDGREELCTLTYGPTSGLFTVTFTATRDGKTLYLNTFNLPYGELRFEKTEKGLKLHLTGSQYGMPMNPVVYDVSVDNGRIVWTS